jgi:hypothetical protein
LEGGRDYGEHRTGIIAVIAAAILSTLIVYALGIGGE